ncbi:hypothetical protein NLI96_g5904 [Meripilus lineatus]|uniref:Uncharacterized protein n=1 Tax=Meripilus lineatus TaxID=2056292 RepID=A0AAD5V499_9APHY|nr:hypothetical protein NLI96_g5904 [Physisporinus lineatus]
MMKPKTEPLGVFNLQSKKSLPLIKARHIPWTSHRHLNLAMDGQHSVVDDTVKDPASIEERSTSSLIQDPDNVLLASGLRTQAEQELVRKLEIYDILPTIILILPL